MHINPGLQYFVGHPIVPYLHKLTEAVAWLLLSKFGLLFAISPVVLRPRVCQYVACKVTKLSTVPERNVRTLGALMQNSLITDTLVLAWVLSHIGYENY